MTPPGFEAGTELRSGGRTITDAEISLLPAYMGAINPLFHDEVAAAESPMGGRVLYGPATLGIGIALSEPFLKGRVAGLLEIGNVRFRRPVRCGDTLSATLRVVGVSPRAGREGLVLTTDDTVANQLGENVLTFSRRILLRTPPAPQVEES